MTPPPPNHDWTSMVARYARTAGIDLSPQTIDELATHLEDLYLAARERGEDDATAREQARQTLEASGLIPLRQEPRPNPRAAQARTANDTAFASRFRSLSMMYALRMALRQFRQHPTFALVTVLVLGLGTGAATVVYTIVDSVVLRPLPYEAPDRLVKFWDTNTEKGLGHDPISPVTFMDYRALSVFKEAAAWWRPDVNLLDPGLDPVRVKTIETSANLFSVLGVRPQVGPGFPADGPFFSRELVAVISDRLWRTRYNADPGIIGRQLRFNERPFTIVGVMPPAFRFPDDIDVWQRLTWDLTQHSRAAHFMEGVARLSDGTSIEQARAAAETLAARLGTEFETSNKGWVFGIVPLLDDQLGYYRPALYVLFGAVGLLFVIGCLNIASLLLTRALSREREVAVRTALGATPRQIITQLLAESFILSCVGAAAGLLIALVALPLIVAVTPVEVPRLAEAAISGRILALALGLVGGMTMVFGAVPAIVLVRAHVGSDLRSGERGSSRGTRRIYQAMVVAEVALACALLVSSALLVRTVGQMTRVPLGVAGDNVMLTSVQMAAADSSLAAWQTVGTLHDAILDRVREQPGVLSAGATNFLPMEHGWRNPFVLGDQPAGRPEDRPQAQHHSVSDGYFETMGATLVEGRFFSAQDSASAEPVVILNETLAKRFFPGASPVGREMLSWSSQIGPLGRNLTWKVTADGHRTQPRIRVVGVVADVQNVALGLPAEPAIYFPARQFPFSAMTLAISARDSATALAAVKQALRSVSPNTPLGAVESWRDRFNTRTAEPRLLMTTLTAFGSLAAFLAALGVYGLFSWSVALRRRELAIRLTLGAKPVSVAANVVRHSVVLVVLGLVGGWSLVQAAKGALATVLFGVTATDATSTITAAAALFIAALVASLPPAWRAMRVDPVEGLRAE
ncbi:MAG TPA: ABC transporter permease [Vicinamibacterales bacterium]|nr:ABC transporter permease [Vicinamibacterales bacterium]